MASTGFSAESGATLSDFEHVQQSIGIILKTPIGSRVMRRDFGSEIFDLIDRPLTDRVILAVYSAAAMAIARWEPRFAITGCRLVSADADGRISLVLAGVYYPRGHLGDFTPDEADRELTIDFTRSAA